MNKDEIDRKVEDVCKKFDWVIPETWCYPGDLIFDTLFHSLFLCGDDPKDVAELRRRRVSFQKVDTETLRKFLIENKN
jgi:hypothetical protein